MSASFRFDAARHDYIHLVTGRVLPHITGLLEQAGWVDSEHYTEESRDRGTAVHRLCEAYDIGALENPAAYETPFKGWLLAHVEAMSLIRPTILAIERPLVHPQWLYGGRPDRVVSLRGRRGVIDIKSGAKDKAHRIQTALQAILDAVESKVPPRMAGRWALYLKPTGRFVFEEHTDRRDVDEAERILKEYAR